VGNITFFVIFAVLDVSLAVNLCINCSFLHLLKLTAALVQVCIKKTCDSRRISDPSLLDAHA